MSILNFEQNEKLVGFRQEISERGDCGRILDSEGIAARLEDTHQSSGALATTVVVQVSNEGEVRAILDCARKFRLSVHPISSGHNWGYGTARPTDGSTRVILDLSSMNRIISFDPALGVVTLEPGVTQGQLDTFLAARGADFMVPTTGAGPSCSLVGNALERGYGLTPIADHFQSVLGLRAVLADGTLYSSPFLPVNPDQAISVSVYRWGVGPYLDGLFAQNGGAIVTGITFQLMPRPERTEIFLFWLDEDGRLEATIEAMRNLLTKSGLSIGGINLMNAARVSAVAGAQAVRGAAWIGTGVVYGDSGVINAGRKVIRRALSPFVSRIAFVNEGRLSLLEKLARAPLLGSKLAPIAASARSAYEILSGHPNEFALALPYGPNPAKMPKTGRDPARDGCGLLWYAPIVPMCGQSARRYTTMVEKVCRNHGFNAAVTFSTLSVAAFDSTIPLIFDRDEANSARAMECLRELITEGRKLGFNPYRFHSALMDEATSGADNFWQLADKIRTVLDPQGLISPGRYQRANSRLLSKTGT